MFHRRRKLFLFFLISAFSALAVALPVYGAPTLVFLDKPVVDIFRDAANWLLSIAGGLALLMLIIGGIWYIFSGSNPDNQEKAKKIITYALVGMALILISYAILVVIERIAAKP